MNQITGDRADWALSLAGDGQAFGRVFDRHAARLRRHAVGLVAGPGASAAAADADDVVAMTFLEAWRRREDVRFVDDSLLPWLLVTATNTAHNVTRSARRHRAFLGRFPLPEAAPDPAEHFSDGGAVAAMGRLSLDDQRVLTLCVLEGLGEREAAAVLGVRPGTVKSRLHRAKARLHQRYTATAEPLGGAL
ncbi:RNA polymerase sigma factor [Curtobacterium caseinilyticum]|uniref:RNA polymerase sigma factor n=1 Tax=Curtobacterium caseinilyticum TaxID=3055137 RepID=A0ABT7TTT1_9MICO|nr:RNA polymerase sigma factor [Curtobacterium caseinilyticum]MDM7892921.1 RNA polymerase sigma factor [Curtobacterium caseinilyticum]